MKASNFRILLFGGSPTRIEEINTLIRLEGVQELVLTKGFLPQNELIAHLVQASIAVIPNTKAKISWYYTSPIKLFEYLALGLPVVASDLPSMREVLTEGEHCLFAEAENAIDLARKLDGLLLNEPLQERMKQNNLLLAKDYDWQKRVERIIRFCSS